ncbi:MAG: glycosyltransferase family 39 protein [Deltaproteobacteria bacterium]|nr:glycosyltransferase family 39 protein [Deltaproteobacteria bacterium]
MRSLAASRAGVGTGLAAIVTALALLAWPAIGQTPFYTKGEPREGLVVQTIVRGQGLILPLRNGDEIPSKPPLFHWLGALVSVAQNRLTPGRQDHRNLTGIAAPTTTGACNVSEAAVRAPSLISALIVLIATALTAYRWFGGQVALLSALVLATSVQWLASSVSARVDMVLAAAVSLALLAFARSYEARRPIPPLAYGLLTAAALAKGPVGVVLPVTIAVMFLALRGDLTYLGRRDLHRLGAAVGVAALWYVAAFAIAGDAFVAKQIFKENLFRVIDPDSVEAGHVRPFWFYLPLLLAGFAPWSLFLPAFAASLWPRRGQWRSVALLLPAVWCSVTIAAFSLAGSKRGVYLLPAYPALALLAGQAWSLLARSRVSASPQSHVDPPGQDSQIVADAALADPPSDEVGHDLQIELEAPPPPHDENATLSPLSPRWSRWSSVALAAGCGLVAIVTALPLLLVAAHLAGLPVSSALDLLLGNVDMQNVPAVLAGIDEHRGRLLVWCVATLGALAALIRSTRRQQWSQALACVATAVAVLAALTSSSVLPALARRRTPEPFVRRIAEVVPAGASLSFYGGFDYAAVFYRGTPIPFRARLSDVPEPDGAWLLTWRASLPALREEAGKLVISGQAAATYDVDEVLYDADAQRPDRPSLVLARIVRRIGDERSDGK